MVSGKNGLKPRVSGSITFINQRKQAEMDLVKAQKAALALANAAGKAEFATEVLHNIGNILSSLNVSGSKINELVVSSKLPLIARACNSLGKTISELENGQSTTSDITMLAAYLERASNLVVKDFDNLVQLSADIRGMVGLMRQAIEAQQQTASETVGLEPQDLIALVEEALKIKAHSLIESNIRVIQEYALRPRVVAPAAGLIHVFVNLIKNAIEAMTSRVEPKILRLTADSDGDDRVYLRFIDNGSGIEADHLQNMFTRGFTTKVEGHGFGLEFCRKTMRELGGDIVFESDGPGRGAVISLVFPAVTFELDKTGGPAEDFSAEPPVFVSVKTI